MTNDMQPVELDEKCRVYQYAAGTVVLRDVVELIVRPSGSHRVATADGRLHVIASGWLAIHIDNNGRGWDL